MTPLEANAFRRCHHCDAVCAQRCAPDEMIGRCGQCGGIFAPFFYFDDKALPIHLDDGLRTAAQPGDWRGIQGLTAHWPDET